MESYPDVRKEPLLILAADTRDDRLACLEDEVAARSTRLRAFAFKQIGVCLWLEVELLLPRQECREPGCDACIAQGSSVRRAFFDRLSSLSKFTVSTPLHKLVDLALDSPQRLTVETRHFPPGSQRAPCERHQSRRHVSLPQLYSKVRLAHHAHHVDRRLGAPFPRGNVRDGPAQGRCVSL